MKKVLVASVLGFALSVTFSQAQSNVYSATIAGYVNQTNSAGTLVLLANPLDNGTNDLYSLLPTVANGSVVYVFTGGALVSSTKTKGSWTTDFIIPQGTGFFLKGNVAGTNAFVGQTGFTADIVCPQGVSILVGSPIPFSGTIDQTGTNTLNLGILPNGSSINIFQNGGLVPAVKTKGVWTQNFQIVPGEGFYIKSGAPIDIHQVLNPY